MLVLTTIDLDEHVFAAVAAGASGFLLKDATPDQDTPLGKPAMVAECEVPTIDDCRDALHARRFPYPIGTR